MAEPSAQPTASAPSPVPAPSPASGPSRRAVLTGGAVAVVGAGAVGAALGVAGGARASTPAAGSAPNREAIANSRVVGLATEPFFARRQSGIITPPQSHAAFCAFDLDKGATRAQAQGVLRAWSQDAARLTSGQGGLADLDRELAEGPSRLTVTIGLGPRFFDIIGLPDRRPTWLRALPAFPEIDKLEERWTGGDLLVQLCADDPLVVSHAARVLGSGVRGVASLRWKQRGFRRAVGTDPSGRTQRNLLGQVDGTVNPGEADSDFDRVMFSDGSDQRWMRDGSSVVVRRIRYRMDAWEQIDRHSRELAVGRTLDTGAPLTGTQEKDAPDFAAVNDAGLPVIPSESHSARAHQRNRDEVILRRPYNYDESPDPGQLSESGLVFASYQADPVRQFLPIQKRLADKDSLNTWIVPIGSAVFALPPGAADGGYVGQTLFEG